MTFTMSLPAFSLSLSLAMLAAVLLQASIPSAVLASTNMMPSKSDKLSDWIAQNIKEYNERKNDVGLKALDPALTAAEDNPRLIKVSKEGKADFTTITDALKSIPSGNTRRTVISIAGGVYREKITIERTKPFVTFYGEEGKKPNITFDGTAAKYGTVYSATVAVESDYFVAVNIGFVNSAPRQSADKQGAQAVAMRISGDKAAFYNCHFIGFQDTLCDDKGKHLFKECYIEGTVDFIFGNGRSLYLKTEIRSVAEGVGVITAQGRAAEDENSGFTFAYCKITGTGDMLLGRAWKEKPRVVFAYTYMGSHINAQGWSDSMKDGNKRETYYGEYKCEGPGATSSARAQFAKMLTLEEANAFLSMTYIQGNKWVLPPPKPSFLEQKFSPAKLQ